MNENNHKNNDKDLKAHFQEDINNPSNNKRKKKSFSSKNQIAAEYMANSNDSIYFKIINTEEEFKSFNAPIGQDNLDNTFQPKYTYNIFTDKQEIIGYKNLRIKISLTPKTLSPYINIQYEDALKIKDDIIYLLRDFYNKIFEQSEHYYEENKIVIEEILQTSEERFLKYLASENEVETKHNIVCQTQKDSLNLEIIHLSVLESKFFRENLLLQCFLTYFIDGGSPIPLDTGFWNYFILFEKDKDSKRRLIGFCSTHHFHLEITRYRSLTSQFLIMPNQHRKGYGQFLLEEIYNYYMQIPECIQISTEDPAKEFEILRDIVIFKRNLELGHFEKFLKLPALLNKDTYKLIKFTKEDLDTLSTKLKISKAILQSSLDILKYCLINRKESKSSFSILIKEYKRDIKIKFFKAAREDYEVDYDFNRRKMRKKRGPYIFLHDEEEKVFDIDSLELQQMSEVEVKEILEGSSNAFIDDMKAISVKCEKLINDHVKN